MPDDPALRYIAQRLDDMGADLKETRKEVTELSSRDRADVLRFQGHDKRLTALESDWNRIRWLAISAILAALLGLVIGVDLPL